MPWHSEVGDAGEVVRPRTAGTAREAELLLQYLTGPYLRVPLYATKARVGKCVAGMYIRTCGDLTKWTLRGTEEEVGINYQRKVVRQKSASALFLRVRLRLQMYRQYTIWAVMPKYRNTSTTAS